ncbi:MAG: InlB B-repeat-containing protein, partial [Clostridiales Family XIII bacterium]|nr:InlB B-repeat-containing protein [Clostridiales Family XIII bacterium]
TFNDYDGKALKTQTVEYGGNATAPADPARTGYIFAGWDKPSTAWQNVTADVTVTAAYKIDAFTVTFNDYDGKALKAQTVEYGGNATAPADPARKGYTFAGWDKPSAAWQNVTADVTVTAAYRKDAGGGNAGDSEDENGGGSGGGPGGGNRDAGTTPGGSSGVTAPHTSDNDPGGKGEKNTGDTVTDGASDQTTGGSPVKKGGWSLFALIMTLLTVASALCALVIAAIRKTGAMGENGGGDKDAVSKKPRALPLVVAAAAAVGSVALFLLTQDTQTPMVVFNAWSVIFGLVGIIGVICSALGIKAVQRENG